MSVKRAQLQKVQSLVLLKVAAAKVMLRRDVDPSLIDSVLKSGREKRAISSDPVTMALMGAATGGGLGSLHGLLDPGYDERGKRRSRLAAMLSRGASGAAIGGIGGGLGRWAYSGLSDEAKEKPAGGTAASGTAKAKAPGGATTGGAAGGVTAGGATNGVVSGVPGETQAVWPHYVAGAAQGLNVSGLLSQVIADARGGQSLIANTAKKIPLVEPAAKALAAAVDKAREVVRLSPISGSPRVPPGIIPGLKSLGKGTPLGLALGTLFTGMNVAEHGFGGAAQRTQDDVTNAVSGEYGFWGGLGTLAGQFLDPIGNAQFIADRAMKLPGEVMGAGAAWGNVAGNAAKDWGRGR